jgi:hypothetical protein
MKAVGENEIEMARNELRVSNDPYEVWECYRVSVADVERIAREEGITLPRDWFRAGQRQVEAGRADFARAEVERIEDLLAKARNNLASAQVPAQTN